MLGSKQKMIEKEDAAYLEKALAAWKDAQRLFGRCLGSGFNRVCNRTR